jgi:uncharacterized protein (TIGR00255 family)
MTGFGKAVVELNNKTVHIEVRSVNSKNFDFYARMPQYLREKEPEMRKLAQSILNRGKVEINLSETQGELSSSVSINTVALKKHFESINTVANDLGLNADADLLGSIMRIPDVLVPEQMELDPEEWEQIKGGFNKACLSMDEFRKREGAALKTDFEARINHIRAYQQEIKPYEEARIHHLKSKFEKDLSSVIDRSKIDQNRLEQEIIFYLEKLDITEEQVRLSQHLDYFSEVLNEELSQGRKLNFIGQEIGRELNTLGSKANQAEIQKLIVNMKDGLEKIKEQMLNIL